MLCSDHAAFVLGDKATWPPDEAAAREGHPEGRGGDTAALRYRRALVWNRMGVSPFCGSPECREGRVGQLPEFSLPEGGWDKDTSSILPATGNSNPGIKSKLT